ncbi:hypothetical protein QE152_g29021 [Popillia japonica]|uniref:Uncharacterized protein n=1 Tax=Popillia japonica TaxID=7064 RepID=A0AAW1JIW5_POPJA
MTLNIKTKRLAGRRRRWWSLRWSGPAVCDFISASPLIISCSVKGNYKHTTDYITCDAPLDKVPWAQWAVPPFPVGATTLAASGGRLLCGPLRFLLRLDGWIVAGGGDRTWSPAFDWRHTEAIKWRCRVLPHFRREWTQLALVMFGSASNSAACALHLGQSCPTSDVSGRSAP